MARKFKGSRPAQHPHRYHSAMSSVANLSQGDRVLLVEHIVSEYLSDDECDELKKALQE
jgi:hypothetical protein